MNYLRLIKLKNNTYKISEIVAENKQKAEVYTITWPELFETKQGAITHLETTLKVKFNEFEYKSLMYSCEGNL